MLFSDTNEKLEYQEVIIEKIVNGKIEFSQGKNKTFTVWKDDEKILNEVPPACQSTFSEGSSSQRT